MKNFDRLGDGQTLQFMPFERIDLKETTNVQNSSH